MPKTRKPGIRWVRVARVSDVPRGQVRGVEAEGRKLALVNRDGEWFALDAVCPHQGGPLDEGSLWQGAVECPWHHYRFDPATGKNLYPADVYPEDMPQLQADVQPVETFPVDVRGEEVFVGLPG
ncbi:MAG TPA: Rieske 2Fe-2S domain-containing protein [Terriglobales bacterium]|nr:Rieske 2Fe-2S domain-containing protein [Terriglobales bacterium]